MRYSKEIEKQVDVELQEHGYTREDFSNEELAELKAEIKERQNAPEGFMLDGFWSSEGPGSCRQFEKKLGLWSKENKMYVKN